MYAIYKDDHLMVFAFKTKQSAFDWAIKYLTGIVDLARLTIQPWSE